MKLRVFWEDRETGQRALLAGFLALVTVVVFVPSLFNGFTNWDDPIYVTGNEAIRTLSAASVKNIFTSFHYGAYKPVVFLSFAVDYYFFRLEPMGYHAVNLFVHLLSVLLVFRLLLLIKAGTAVAFLTALLFAVHPLRVESVAWITERKDVLYAFFFLLSLVCYGIFRQTRRAGFYALSLGSFLLSLLSKPMALMLPLILWAWERAAGGGSRSKTARRIPPFFIVLAAVLLVNFFAHESSTDKQSVTAFGFPDNLLMTAYAVFFYLKKIFFPLNLSCLYSYPQKIQGFLPPVYFLSLAGAAGLAFVLAKIRKRSPGIFLGFMFFLAALVPVLPLALKSSVTLADRYTYVASIGIFYIVAEIAARLYGRSRGWRAVIVIALAAVVLTLSFLTRERIRVWKNSVVLWTDAIRKNPYRTEPYVFRGLAFFDQGQAGEALMDYDTAIGMNPRLAEAHVLKGNVYLSERQAAKARESYNRAVEISPEYALAYYNRANSYFDQGLWKEAIADYEKALDINPEYAKALYNRGMAYLQEREYEKALLDLRKALSLGMEVDQAMLSWLEEQTKK
ncbi:MAG: tetratricopeptide repeat protein [Candidatus Omnitrophota bacterium]